MSPSRLMAVMDPLISTGFLWRCLAAYSGIKSDDQLPRDELPATASVSSTGEAPEDDPLRSEQMQEDTYYTRLGPYRSPRSLLDNRSSVFRSGTIMGSRQAFLLRKLRESSLPTHRYMSPLRAPDDTLRQFPTTYLIVSTECWLLLLIVRSSWFCLCRVAGCLSGQGNIFHLVLQACHQDPLLDDSISFACLLRSLSVEHYLVFIHNLPHGFLNFYTANHYCKDASDRVMGDIARRYDIQVRFSPTSKKKKSTSKKSSLIITNHMMNTS